MGRRVERGDGPFGAGGALLAPLTALIGRAADLRAVGELLHRSRLVTLTGPAGVGKTRTAVELGRSRAGQRADGVCLVDLAAVAEADDVVAEVARAFGLHGVAREATAGAVQRYVAARDLLLLLDNCEHVLDACVDLTATLLGTCPTLRVLATSREPLGIAGEAVWRLDPLAPEYAYRLFMERARERRPQLVPDGDMQGVILEICASVDGLPLGVELAAARVSVMSPQEIVASLGAHLAELGRAPRRAPDHHRSIRAAVGWSYGLLDPVEQAAFRSLAVFVGGFDAEAARAVASGMSLDVLARLVDKSLIMVVPNGDGPTRYRLLATMRAFASERLTEAGETDDARARHLRFFAAIGIPVEAGWMSARVVPLLKERAADYANVRAAVEWASATQPCQAMRLLAETKDLFFMLGQADGSRLAELVLVRCPERSRLRAELMIAAGHFAYLLGKTATANRLMIEAANLGVELGERTVEGTAHWFLGLHQMFAGSREWARGHLATARAIQQETGDRLGEARTTAALGLCLWMDDKPGQARELLQEALSIGQTAQDRWSQGQANLYLGMLAESTDEHAAASGFFQEAVQCLRPYRDSTLLPVALVGQARILTGRDPVTALKLVAAAWAARGRNGGEFAPFYRTYAEQTRAGVTAAVAGDGDRLWSEGSRLTVEDAAALAFGSARPPATHALGISNREIDVVRLIADGLSNKEIAARLHMSVRTVESHVRHALTKTGLVNRTQLAMWARHRGAGESVLPP